MRWLRLHTEARTDRKLDTLTDSEFRVWFNLLCMAGDSEERGTVIYEDPALLALEVAKGDIDLLSHALSRLVTLRVVTSSDNRVTFVNFQKRQYDKPSDAPEQTRLRKEKSRLNQELSRDVTPGHATYTDTDTEKESESPVTPVEETTHTPRKRKSQIPDGFTPSESGRAYAMSKGIPERDIPGEVERFVTYHQAKGNTFVSHDKAWQKWCMEYRPRPHSGNVVTLPTRQYVNQEQTY